MVLVKKKKVCSYAWFFPPAAAKTPPDSTCTLLHCAHICQKQIPNYTVGNIANEELHVQVSEGNTKQ